MTSPSQPRNARTAPIVRSRGQNPANDAPDFNDLPEELKQQLLAMFAQGNNEGQRDDEAPQAPLPQQTSQQAAPANPLAPVSEVKSIDDFCNVARHSFNWFRDREPEQKFLDILNGHASMQTFQKTDFGFQFNVAGTTRTVSWLIIPGGANNEPDQERIQGQSAGFSMDDAHAMVALSAVNGWRKINVHGSDREKDLLWLAAKMQGLEVANYEPNKNSDVYQQWQEISPGIDSGPVKTKPLITPDTSAPGPTPPAPLAPTPPTSNDNTPPAAPDAPAPDAQNPDKMDLSHLTLADLRYMRDHFRNEAKYAKSMKNLDAAKQAEEFAQAAVNELAARKQQKAAPEAAAPGQKPAPTKKPAAKKTTLSDKNTTTPHFNDKAEPLAKDATGPKHAQGEKPAAKKPEKRNGPTTGGAQRLG